VAARIIIVKYLKESIMNKNTGNKRLQFKKFFRENNFEETFAFKFLNVLLEYKIIIYRKSNE